MIELYYSHFIYKRELVEIVGYFGSTLSTKHKHCISCYSQSKVTTGGWYVPFLLDLER